MVLILDGNSLTVTHVRRNLSFFYLIKAFDYIESKIGYFYPKKSIFPHVCAICYERPSDMSTMVVGEIAKGPKSPPGSQIVMGVSKSCNTRENC